MSAHSFRFVVHDERLAIVRLPHDASLPAWVRGSFVNIARTPSELSIVCEERYVPADVLHERDRVALSIAGTVAMDTVGVLAALCAALASAGVPVFVLSTYDTDWLLVSADRCAAACAALRMAGHQVDLQRVDVIMA